MNLLNCYIMKVPVFKSLQFVRFVGTPDDFLDAPMMCFGTPSEVM